MLQQLILKNYKAFDEVIIPIRPLTILLGANSVGKSSIIQMLMLLHQTAEEKGNSYGSALKIYGRYVNAGAIENLYKRRQTDKPIEIDLTFESATLANELREAKGYFVRGIQDLCGYFPLKNLWELQKKEVKSLTAFTAFIKNFFELLNKRGADEYKPHMERFLKRRLGIPKSEFESFGHKNILNTYKLLEFLEKGLQDNSFRIRFEISLNKEKTKLYTDKAAFYIGGNICLISFIRTPEGVVVRSDIANLDNDDQPILASFFINSRTIFDCIENQNEGEAETTAMSFALYGILQKIMVSATNCLSEYKINYVSPLRAHPKRYYMLDKAKMTISLDTLDGDAIAEVLKENKKVKVNVNNWLSRFGFEVNVAEFKEVIHHVNVKQDGLSLDITDVGFGISQVLPIIIQGFLSIDKSLTIIEQPEIHLHPVMQADLGDLFIDIVNSRPKKLIIETHSEYLLKRIRRRMSEGVIPPEMVSICLFHAKTEERDAWVETLEIGSKGGFEWPKEFYGGELYDDTVEFLKNQG